MAERHWTILRLLAGLCLNNRVLRYLGEEDYHESCCKDCECDEHQREDLANLRLNDVWNEYTRKEDNQCTHQRVERSTNLHELVTAVATASELIQHRVNHEVEQAHRETCNKSTEEVYSKGCEARQKTCDGLNTYTHKADCYGQESCVLVTSLLQDVTTRDTHYGVCNKVAQHTECCHPVRNSDLLTCKVVLQHITHWRGEVGNKRNHTEEQYTHNDCRHCRILFL